MVTLLKMLFPSRIYIARGPWYLGDFSNIFLPNISEDQKKSYYLSAGPWLCAIWQIPEVESRTQGSRPRTQKKSEAKAKDSLFEDRHSRGQGQECLRLRPKTKNTSASALQKKKKLHKNFSGDLQKKKKKVFTKIFQAISTIKRFPKIFSSTPQNFNNSKNSAVLEPRTGKFSRT